MDLLSKKIMTLESEIEKLRDENEILWFILEQVELRITKNDDYREIYNEIYKESRLESLMRIKNDSEA